MLKETEGHHIADFLISPLNKRIRIVKKTDNEYLAIFMDEKPYRLVLSKSVENVILDAINLLIKCPLNFIEIIPISYRM